MKILGINTATGHAAVAMVEIPATGKAKTLFTKSWQSDRNEAEKVLPAISAALKKGPPGLIFAVTGPGAFTGLRIGVTVANTLAFIYDAPILGVSTYDFLRARTPQVQAQKTALLLKAGGEFAAVLMPEDKHPRRLAAGELASFFRKNRRIKFVIGDMNPEERRKYPLPIGITWLNEKSLAQLPAIINTFAAKKVRRTKAISPHYMLPPKITQSKKPIFAAAATPQFKLPT
jgi:tRNA threonylcarbamoyl adenosine modification protein YeaZ